MPASQPPVCTVSARTSTRSSALAWHARQARTPARVSTAGTLPRRRRQAETAPGRPPKWRSPDASDHKWRRRGRSQRPQASAVAADEIEPPSTAGSTNSPASRAHLARLRRASGRTCMRSSGQRGGACGSREGRTQAVGLCVPPALPALRGRHSFEMCPRRPRQQWRRGRTRLRSSHRGFRPPT